MNGSARIQSQADCFWSFQEELRSSCEIHFGILSISSLEGNFSKDVYGGSWFPEFDLYIPRIGIMVAFPPYSSWNYIFKIIIYKYNNKSWKHTVLCKNIRPDLLSGEWQPLLMGSFSSLHQHCVFRASLDYGDQYDRILTLRSLANAGSQPGRGGAFCPFHNTQAHIAAQTPRMHREAPVSRNCLAPNANWAKVEKWVNCDLLGQMVWSL